jgi:hypothetical protein
MTLGELRVKLTEIPADYLKHASALLEDDETGWRNELTEVAWDVARDDPGWCVWLHTNSK